MAGAADLPGNTRNRRHPNVGNGGGERRRLAIGIAGRYSRNAKNRLIKAVSLQHE
jgi:hypothetical protein